MKKGAACVIALLSLLTIIGAISAVQDEGTKVLAIFGEEDLTLQEFVDRHPALASWFGWGAKVEDVQATLEQMIFHRLMAREALQSGLANQPKIRVQIDELLASEYLRSRIPRGAISVGEAEVRDYYDKHLEMFKVPPMVRMAHILVASEEEARAIHRALQDGRAFDTLAMERSMDPASAQKGGGLGWVAPGKLAPQLAETVLALAPGHMSGVVQTEFGYHIVKLEEKPPPKYQPYGEVKNEIQKKLFAEKQAVLTNEVKGELWQKYEVAVNLETLRAAVQESPGGTVGEANTGLRTSRLIPTKEAVKQGPMPQLRLLSEMYDLGAIPAETVTHISLVRNNGDAELIIQRVHTTCRCAQATISPERLAAGQTGKLTIIFDPNRFKTEGRTSNSIYIESNDPHEPRKIIHMTAEVVRG